MVLPIKMIYTEITGKYRQQLNDDKLYQSGHPSFTPPPLLPVFVSHGHDLIFAKKNIFYPALKASFLI